MTLDHIDKAALRDAAVAELKRAVATLTAAAATTVAGATHAEAKPENDKDTRAVEQSYLARGQAMRVAETGAELSMLRAMPLVAFGEGSAVAVSAVVELDVDGDSQLFFLVPAGGGRQLTIEGVVVQLLSLRSPLGRALIGRFQGDAFELRVAGHDREYFIESVR